MNKGSMNYDESSFVLFSKARLHTYAHVSYLWQVWTIVKLTIQDSTLVIRHCEVPTLTVLGR